MLNKIREASKNLIIPFSFIPAISMLYYLYPNSFELAWKGRAPYIFFLWLLLLELILSWRKLLEKNFGAPRLFKTVAIAIAAATPTIYVICVFLLGLNHNIMELGKIVGVPYQKYPEIPLLEWHWPLSFECLLFTAFFIACVWLMYKIDGLKRFSISLFFMGATSFFFMIDTFYPFGTPMVLQAFAPITASSAVHVLNLMGYNASISRYQEGMPVLRLKGQDVAAVGWPCAGVQSLFIYTFMILLFLKDATFSLVRKVIYVAVGAVGTFIVNILRVVIICIIGINSGPESMILFHSYYGELFFLSWAVTYSMAIIYSGKIWGKLSALGTKLAES